MVSFYDMRLCQLSTNVQCNFLPKYVYKFSTLFIFSSHTMACSSEIFNKLEKIKSTFNYYIPKPSYYQNNKQQSNIIISTHHQENNNKAGIYSYNIDTNTINIIHKYHKNFNPYNHGQFLDTQNNIFYVFRGWNDDVFGSLNMENMHFNHNKTNIICKCGTFPS